MRTLFLGVLRFPFLLLGIQTDDVTTIPPGTNIPIRILQTLTSGKDTVGTPVLAQTMVALTKDSCVIVPPYVLVGGRLVISRGGRAFARPGQLEIHFDSVQTQTGRWTGIQAVLDSLEWVPDKSISDSGGVQGARPSIPKRAAEVGVVAATGVGMVPVAALAGYVLVRTGPRAAISAGQTGSLRLTAPFTIQHAGCTPLREHRSLFDTPALPAFPAHASDQTGNTPGDPINLILLGSRLAIDSAFARADWTAAAPLSTITLAEGVTAAILERPDRSAPVSTEYFEGRPEDMAFEQASPSARVRHHVRIWQVDSTATLWAAAANEDVGLKIDLAQGEATHQMSPEVDLERDLLVRDLLAGGCAVLAEYLTIPGALTSGKNTANERYVTDGRAAVLQLSGCRALP